MNPDQQIIVATLESTKAKEMAEALIRSDNSLTQLHVALSIVYTAIEESMSLVELKNALFVAIKVRKD